MELGQRANGGAPAFARLAQRDLQSVDASLPLVQLTPDPADAPDDPAVDVSAGLHAYHSVIWPMSA